MLHNEYIRFTLAIMLICIAVIAIWLILRRVKLWYSETGTVLEALDTISFRLEHVEDKLGIANHDALDISENIYVIGSITEENKAIQMAMHEDIRSSRQTQEKIVVEVSEIHELLLADPVLAEKKEVSEEMGCSRHYAGRDFQEITLRHNDRESLYKDDEAGYEKSYDGKDGAGYEKSYDDDDDDNDIDELWLDDLDDIFPEDDEDEIRKKIRL